MSHSKAKHHKRRLLLLVGSHIEIFLTHDTDVYNVNPLKKNLHVCRLTSSSFWLSLMFATAVKVSLFTWKEKKCTLTKIFHVYKLSVFSEAFLWSFSYFENRMTSVLHDQTWWHLLTWIFSSFIYDKTA